MARIRVDQPIVTCSICEDKVGEPVVCGECFVRRRDQMAEIIAAQRSVIRRLGAGAAAALVAWVALVAWLVLR